MFHVEFAPLGRILGPLKPDLGVFWPDFSPFREGRFLLPGNDRRPADVLIRNWVGGKDAALDVTVVTPLQDATMPAAANTAGHALSHATPMGEK